MRIHPLFLLAALLLLGAGCSCPTFEGLDGVLTFQACDDLQRPLMKDSVFPIELVDEAEDATTTWVSDDPGVAAVTGAAQAWAVSATELGSAEVSVTADGGEQDRLAFEVVAGVTASLRDPWTDLVSDLMVDREDEFWGEIPLLQPRDPVQIFGGSSLDLTLEVLDAGGRAISWSPEAIDFVNADPGQDVGSVTLSLPGTSSFSDGDGAQLLAVNVVEAVDLTGATIALGAMAPPRTEPEEVTRDTSFALGYLQAVVTDAAGEPIYQTPLQWSSRGIGTHGFVVDGFVVDGATGSPGRSDIVLHTLEGNEANKWESAVACVSVSLDDAGLVASALLAPAGVEFFEDSDCGGAAVTPGCGCSAVDPQGASMLSLLVAAGLLSRRRRAAARPGRDGRFHTAA